MDFSLPPQLALNAFKDATHETLVAVLEVMHFVARADGAISADELRQFLKFAKTVSLGKISAGELSALVSGWNERGEVDAPARLAELAAILSHPTERRATYELASRMATADGKLESAEEGVLGLIEVALELE